MILHPKIVVIFLLLSCSVQLKSQNINEFYFEANTARKLARDGKTDSAITTYENAFKKVDYVHITYLQRVLELAKLNKDDARINKYTQQIKKQAEGTSPQLKAIVDSLIKVDQKMRTGVSSLISNSRYAAKCDYQQNGKKKSKRYKKSKIVLEKWVKTDSLNTHYLLTLFKKHGFIGEELLGSWGLVNVSSILLHFDTDTDNAILGPILEKARKEGKIEPQEFACILDRHLGGEYTIQKYWFWPYIGKGKLQFSEAELSQIIKSRESIGIYDVGLRQVKYSGIWSFIGGDYWLIQNYYTN
jgi:hypothetical protein